MGRSARRNTGRGDQTGISVCQVCWAGGRSEVVGRVPLCGLGVRPDVQTRGVDCFGVCEGDSVSVVRPGREGRDAGGRPVWLRDLHDPDVLDAVGSWLDEGGPGIADEPDLVAIHAFTPSRRIRSEHEG